MSCGSEDPIIKHTVVPQKGDAGDSTGYMSVVPSPGDIFPVRQRWPFPFTLALIASDGVPSGGLTYRKAATATLLQEQTPVPFKGSVNVQANETLEVQVYTETEGAVLGFQIIKITS